MCTSACARLGLCPRRGLAEQLGLFDGSHTGACEVPLVVDDGDVFLREVANRVVLDFPKLFGDLRDQTEVVRDDDDAALELLDGTGKCIDRGHVQMVRRLICQSEVVSDGDFYYRRWGKDGPSKRMWGCSMASWEKTTLRICDEFGIWQQLWK